MKRNAFFNKTKTMRIIIPVISLFAAAGIIYAVWSGTVSNKLKEAVLDAPDDITVENEMVSWNQIENALKYKVSFGNSEDETDNEFFSLNGLEESKSYAIRIKALGDNVNYRDSDWSNEITISRLETPALRITKTKLIWNNIDQNSGYELYCNGEYLAHISRDITQYDLLSVKSDCEFQIKARGDRFHIMDSPISEKVSATKLNAPSDVKLNGTVISWSKVSDADRYTVEGDVPKTETKETEYNLKQIKPGKYKISVQAFSDSNEICDSDKSVTDIVVEKKPLGRIGDVSIINDRLVWRKLENASGYRIIITQNNGIVKEITEDSGENFADLSEIGLNDGSYTVEIFAVGNDYYSDSPKESLVYIKTSLAVSKIDLGKIQNAAINLGILKWNALANASGYVVNIMSDSVGIHNTNIENKAAPELDITRLNLAPGSYSVILYALGDSKYNNSDSVSLSYTVTKLAAPTGINYSGSRLKWNSVSNADRYTVTVGMNAPVTVTNNFYDFSLNPGDYIISVQAVSDDREIQASAISFINHTEPKHNLGNIANRRIEHGLFSWDALDHATGYIIEIKDSTGNTVHTFEKAVTNELSVDIYALDLPLGSYTVTIIALGDAVYNDTAEISSDYLEKMIRDTTVRVNFNYGNKYGDSTDYWIQHYLDFGLKRGFVFDNPAVPAERWNEIYTSFLGGDAAAKDSAAVSIGNDIIVTYYYMDDNDLPVVLSTGAGIPFVKNKLWGGWLWRHNGSEYVRLQGDITEPFSIGGIVPSATALRVSANIGRKNPAGGGTVVTSTQLDLIKGKRLYVDIDVIIKNGSTADYYKETVFIDIADFVALIE